MGRLVRGVEGTGCHNFYPDCPFSNQDVLQIARRINFKWKKKEEDQCQMLTFEIGKVVEEAFQCNLSVIFVLQPASQNTSVAWQPRFLWHKPHKLYCSCFIKCKVLISFKWPDQSYGSHCAHWDFGMEDDIWNLCHGRSGVPFVDNPEHKGRKILEKKMMFMARVSLQWWNGDKLTKLTMLTKSNRKRGGDVARKVLKKTTKTKQHLTFGSLDWTRNFWFNLYFCHSYR